MAGGASLLSLQAAPGPSSPSSLFGRLSGAVTDTQGNPLMGATVMIFGPAGGAPSRPAQSAQVAAAGERVITDAHGEFAVEHLVPGWYSIRVVSPTRLPALRNGVLVVSGRTAQLKFVLSDIFAPLRLQTPGSKVSLSGEDWKWVLRSSSATRPVLRYQEATTRASAKVARKPLPGGQRLIGMIPGSSRGDLAGDAGMGSVLAYFRPLSEDSDFLVAGSMAAYGPQASSLATSFRNHIVKGDPQELTLVVHQLSLSDGSQFVRVAGQGNFSRAQGVVVNYSHTRRLSNSLTLMAGFEVDYLNALRDVAAANPHIKLEYRVNPSTFVAVRYGTIRLDDNSNSLLDRVGMLNAFPRVTLRGNHLRLEELSHAEVGLHRRLGKTSRVEIAGYQDYFRNAAVWAQGAPGTSSWLVANIIPNPTTGAMLLNAGDYRSSGIRATYSISLGSHLAGAFDYALGEALNANAIRHAGEDAWRSQGFLRPARSQSFGGKVSTRIPISKTQLTTSYQFAQDGRVTGVDPYGTADLEIQPFLGLQIRQPLPTLSFIPAKIEALADFRNLLGQGYVPAPRAEGRPFLLTSAYRTFRGGFSVQF